MGSVFSRVGDWWRGRGWGRPFTDQVEQTIDRANVFFRMPEDTGLWVAPRSRTMLRERFEWMRQNFGVVEEMTSGIARHAVGKGISLQMNTPELAWNAEAEAQVEEWALTPGRCDAASRRNFYEAQAFAVEQYIGPGEFFSKDTFNEAGEPAFQLYDSNEVRTPEDNADKMVLDGVRVDGQYRPIDYFLREATAAGDSKYLPVPAAAIVHWFKGKTANQVRGVTPFAAGLSNLADIHELKRLTVRSAKAQQLIALMLKGFDRKKSKGALGAIANLGAAAAGYDGTKDTAAVEQLYAGAGGAIAYVGEDGDAKLLSSNSPSPLVAPFISDLLLRDVCLAPGVPAEFFWSPEKLSGANQRFILAKADLFFQLLSDALIYRWIKRQVFRFLSWRITQGRLAKPEDDRWFEKMSFQSPRRITVDNGRDIAAELDQLAAGATTLRDIYDARGLNYRAQIRQWIREVLEFIRIAKEEGAPASVISKWEASVPVWRAHATGAGVGNSMQDTTAPAAAESDNQAAA